MRISCFKKTNENWYANYKIEKDMRHVDEKYVHVSFLKLPKLYEEDEPEFRVCVWGNDDYGMELDSTDESFLKQIYLDICLQEVVNSDYLRKLGFKNA